MNTYEKLLDRLVIARRAYRMKQLASEPEFKEDFRTIVSTWYTEDEHALLKIKVESYERLAGIRDINSDTEESDKRELALTQFCESVKRFYENDTTDVFMRTPDWDIRIARIWYDMSSSDLQSASHYYEYILKKGKSDKIKLYMHPEHIIETDEIA